MVEAIALTVAAIVIIALAIVFVEWQIHDHLASRASEAAASDALARTTSTASGH